MIAFASWFEPGVDPDVRDAPVMHAEIETLHLQGFP
jgi:hypothetical protein